MFHQSHSYHPSPDSPDQVQVEAQVGAFNYHLNLQVWSNYGVRSVSPKRLLPPTSRFPWSTIITIFQLLDATGPINAMWLRLLSKQCCAHVLLDIRNFCIQSSDISKGFHCLGSKIFRRVPLPRFHWFPTVSWLRSSRPSPGVGSQLVPN